MGLAAALLPLITVVLAAWRPHLNLADDLLIYLVAVVTITVLGGFSPAVLAAVAASLLLNWYFTEPLHTFTIQEPKNLLALLLFVTVAVAVSSVVHLAARRAVQAARAREEAASLLELAQHVLGGADSPEAVLDHLTRTHGGQAELQERAGGRWVRTASSHVEGSLAAAVRIDIRDDLTLLVTGQADSATPALLAGYAAQAAAALDRERLRPRPPRPRRWPKATGCGRPCSPPSAMTCARRWPRSRPASAACARRTWSGPRPIRPICSPPSSRTPTGSMR